ncbi:carbohydrate esterase family 4 protein [Serendipita vermifera MAFF 305830]|uniref:chitin deacetylase n=1 Tax=Serendipita vermifera MAFF 305830 TaxID=933852 RepID=A0A0C3AQ79_SERVB|nr:carbohydrate esterase family 4 protein [Serendipita vermifera MAFF 305830]
MASSHLRVLVALAAVSVATACGDHPPPMKRAVGDFEKRQATATYPTGPAYDVPPLASITPTPVSYTENLVPVLQTYAPGSQPPLSGAPPLPAYTIVPTSWPDLQLTPPTNSPEVTEWLRELEGHNIPNIPVNPTVDCGDAANAAAFAAAGESGNCWWTCGGCLRDTDVTQCKDQWDWGHNYDDGPGFYTNKLLTYLNSLPSVGNVPAGVAPGVKATFYVVGARVVSRPEILVYEYMNNHEISIHTWSHSALTTLTNEQIVAELGWTRKAIRDVIGVTPLSFRPPYGDMDDRVRAIALAMGMRPVIWTSSMVGVAPGGSAIQWDSQDWRVHAGTVQPVPNQATFQSVLDSSPQFSNTSSPSYSATHQGVVVLQHDIYVESVNLAIGYTVPYAQSHNPQWKLKTVTECQPRSDGSGLQKLEDAYVETNTDFGNPAWVAYQSHNSSAPPAQTSVITSNGVTRTVTSRPTGSSTSSRNGAVSVKGAGLFGVLAALGLGLVL